MQTATAPRSAYDTFVQGQNSPDFSPLNVHAPRFFVQMGREVVDVDTPAIINKRLLRGEITPCKSWQKIANLLDIREGALIEGTRETDKDGREVWGKEWMFAYHEAERLAQLEAASELKDGICEIQALRSNPQLYIDVNLSALFYPHGLGALPDGNADVIEHLKARLAEINANPPMEVIKYPHYLSVITEIGQELIHATERADSLQRGRIRYTHSCMKMSPKESEYKRDYDAVDEEMLRRTGEVRIHDSEKRASDALTILADRGGDSGIATLVEAQREQNAMLRAQMQQQQAQLAVALEQSQQQYAIIQQLLSNQVRPAVGGESDDDGASRRKPKGQPSAPPLDVKPAS